MIRTRARLDNRSSAPESRSAYGHTHQVSSQRRRVHGGSTEQKNMLVGLLAAPSSSPPCLPFHVVSPSPPLVPDVWEKKRAKKHFNKVFTTTPPPRRTWCHPSAHNTSCPSAPRVKTTLISQRGCGGRASSTDHEQAPRYRAGAELFLFSGIFLL